MLYVVLVAVLHFEGYMRYFAVWVCGFVNCDKYFDKTTLVCKIVFFQLEKTRKNSIGSSVTFAVQAL